MAYPYTVEASCSRFQAIPDLPPTPHQPSASFVYPKRAFGKKNIVWRSLQQAWFKQWTWLHYNEVWHTVTFVSQHLVDVANDFVKDSDQRANVFGKLNNTVYP